MVLAMMPIGLLHVIQRRISIFLELILFELVITALITRVQHLLLKLAENLDFAFAALSLGSLHDPLDDSERSSVMRVVPGVAFLPALLEQRRSRDAFQ